jgi:uncharacterized protein YoxC
MREVNQKKPPIRIKFLIIILLAFICFVIAIVIVANKNEVSRNSDIDAAERSIEDANNTIQNLDN